MITSFCKVLVVVMIFHGGSSVFDSYPIKQQKDVTVEKSWLLGHVAGDGHVRHAPNCATNRYNLGISAGLDKDIADRCVKILYDVYGAESTIKELAPGMCKRKHVNYSVMCYRKEVVEDLLSYAPFGVYRWRVPEKVIAGSAEIRGAWLSGFFDAEGCAYYNVKRCARQVHAISVCHEGLAQVSALLKGLGIRHSLGVCNKANPEKNMKESHRVTIHFHEDLRRFRDIVGFRSPTKKAKLDTMIASYERELVHRDVVKGHAYEIKERRRAGETHAEIASSLGLERETVAHLCYREGVEPEGREGNAASGKRSVALGPIERLLPKIIALREQGVKDAAIANSLGLESAIQVRMAVLRARRDRKIAPLVTKTEEILPQVLSMRAEGKTFREIGECLGHGQGQKAAIWAVNVVSRAKRRGFLDAECKIKPGVFSSHRTGRSEHPLPNPTSPPVSSSKDEAPSSGACKARPQGAEEGDAP